MTDKIWRRAAACDNTGGSCVEVADVGDAVFIRDSKDAAGPELKFSRAEWDVFAAGMAAGDFR